MPEQQDRKEKPRRGRGEGQLEALPNGKYRARASACTDPRTGKRVRPSKVFALVSEARAWLRSQAVRRDRGAGGTTADTVAEWAAEWLAEQKAAVAHGSWRQYREHCELYVLPRLGARKLRDVTPDAVAAFRDALAAARAGHDPAGGTRKPAGPRKVLTTLSVLFGAAVRRGKLAANPCAGVKRPRKDHREVEVLTAGEVRAVLAQMEGRRYAPLYRLLFDSGARPAEVLALHWDDIDAAAGTVRVTKALERVKEPGEKGRWALKPPKTKASRRTVKLSPGTVSSLLSHRDRMAAEGRDTARGPVFVTEKGNWHGQGIMRKRFWAPALGRAGVPYRNPYATRHTCASLLLAAGVSVRAVSRRLGHEDILTTLRHYSHLLKDDDDRCAAAVGAILG